jgi:hypothetical protein
MDYRSWWDLDLEVNSALISGRCPITKNSDDDGGSFLLALNSTCSDRRSLHVERHPRRTVEEHSALRHGYGAGLPQVAVLKLQILLRT